MRQTYFVARPLFGFSKGSFCTYAIPFLLFTLHLRTAFGLRVRRLVHAGLEATVEEAAHLCARLYMVGEVVVGVRTTFALLWGHEQKEHEY